MSNNKTTIKKWANSIKWISIILLVIGMIGWFLPVAQRSLNHTDDYEVKHMKINNIKNYVTDITIYRPKKEGPLPAILFGPGSGSGKTLYSKYAEAFVNEGFVVLIYGPAYGKQNLFTNDNQGWKSVTDCTIENLKYLKELDYVDDDNVIVGGHSGGANTSYRVALRSPNEVAGVIAIAGRWSPETKDKIKTNLFLATGIKDSLVSPIKLKEVAYKLTGREIEVGKLYGSYEDKNAVKIIVSDWSGHLTEAWDKKLITESARWAANSIGEEYKGGYEVEEITFYKIIMMLISGITFFLGAVIYIHKILIPKVCNKFLGNIEPILYFVLIYGIFSSTLSDVFLNLRPVSYKSHQYIAGGIIAILIAWLFSFIYKKTRGKFRIILNTIYILVTICVFVVIVDRFMIQSAPNIWLSTIIFKSAIVFVLLNILSILLYKVKLPQKKITVFNILVLTWLLPIIMPLF